MTQYRVPQELAPRGEIELSLDSLTVRLDRLDAQVQQLGGFSSARPFADHVQNLQFAVGEPLDRVNRCAVPPANRDSRLLLMASDT